MGHFRGSRRPLRRRARVASQKCVSANRQSQSRFRAPQGRGAPRGPSARLQGLVILSAAKNLGPCPLMEGEERQRPFPFAAQGFGRTLRVTQLGMAGAGECRQSCAVVSRSRVLYFHDTHGRKQDSRWNGGLELSRLGRRGLSARQIGGTAPDSRRVFGLRGSGQARFIVRPRRG